jgi:radical SAM superfamily enzyme YgiQ (UPF0313 family)
MDSMVNRYTSDRKLRSDDAYTPGGAGGQAARSRGDGLRAALPRGVRRRADRHRRHRGQPAAHRALRLLVGRRCGARCWSTRKADLLVYGNGERAIVEIAHRLARTARPSRRSATSAAPRSLQGPRDGFVEVDSTTVDRPARSSAADRSVRDGRGAARRGVRDRRASGANAR